MTAHLHWSAEFVGIPWADRGRSREGCDCWGLVRLVHARFGVALPTYDEDYATADEEREIAALIHGVLDVGPWRRVVGRPPAEMDVALFSRGRHDSHVGVVVSPTHMLHMFGEDAAKLERWDTPVWRRRLQGFWRHERVPLPAA
ncbi:NlpC/P60 family protein [Breoghania corrubedonensis]|uniref:NlpC/P60 family protein n=1 Tax=Breoghania corrubedonensis TaxID=665038 RepID=A0A2T5VCG9_9HYPH|nr:NlpC/P60 family protein [Breoghania corrubedonensis]PTW61438.1 NlpC/P60 family protein [Breoghania corrubedonensis]